MNKEQAKQFIKHTFEDSFEKQKFITFIKNLLNEIDETKAFHARGYVKEYFKQVAKVIKTYERIGTYTDPSDKEIDVLIVYLQRKESLDRARTTLRNFVARYLKDRGEKDAALVAFVPPDKEDWRFSLVKMDYRFEKTPSGKVKIKEEFTPARRWSFLAGENEKSHTAQSRLVDILADDEHNPTLSQLEEAFNIEPVTKEFFEKYRNLFIRTVDEMDKIVEKDEKVRKDFKAKNINTVDFAKKLLGQIVFLYFLQKKGWFGVKRDADWGTGPKNFLRELFKRKHGDYKNFFNDILEPLFYEALAKERDDNFYSRFNCKIPFLNGGLFEPIGNYDWIHTDINLPDELFSNSNRTSEGDIGDGILDVFDRFNFTVKEDEPLEKEVAIDPELLGKLYEKFNAIRPDNFYEYKKALASGKKNLEKQFNKKFGVYYTPREIVHYMCQQSLIYYLHTSLNQELKKRPIVTPSQLKLDGTAIDEQLKFNTTEKEIISKDDIEKFIKYGEQFIEDEAVVKEKGKETKNYHHILPESIRKNAKLIDEKLKDIKVCDPAVGSGAFLVGMMSEIVKARNILSIFIDEQDRNIYNFKRECIENSLYGVDIDSGACEITKLRLWLSLVVDEEDFKQIKPLPNLDYKIMQGNSLISEFLGIDFDVGEEQKETFNFQDEVDKLIEVFKEKKNEFLNETNKKRKDKLHQEIDDLIIKIFEEKLKKQKTDYFSQIKAIEEKYSQLPNKEERERVIEEEKAKLYKKTGFNLEDAEKQLKEYTSGRKTRPFFPWKLYFAEVFHQKGGFDVVIANPPYVFTRRMGFSDNFKEYVKRNYFSKLISISKGKSKQSSKINLFSLFIIKAIRLSRVNGVITYILPNTILRGTTYDIIRKYVLDTTRINQIIDLGGGIFDEVTAATIILLMQKNISSKNKSNKLIAILNIKDTALSKYETNIIDQKKFYSNISYTFNIFINSKIYKLLQKIDKQAKVLGNFCMDIIEGIVARKELITQTHISNSFPLVEGKNIKRYYIIPPIKRIIWKPDKIHRTRPLYVWKAPQKIIIQRISGGNTPIIAALDFYKYRTFASVNNLLLKKEYYSYYKFILALLNSKLLNFYYSNNFSNKSELTVNISKTYLEKLPICISKVEFIKNINLLVEHILSLTQSDNYFNNPEKQAKVNEYEKEIDQLVYKLYGLTEEEIKIVENSV